MDSAELLLEHAVWLRRLAASLVGDRAAADDLVQDTWVAAIRRSPASDRSVQPWLARVVRNAARFRWRSDTNRAAREAAVAAGAETSAPSSEDLLARHRLQQQLAKLVGELAEPYRGAILLRYAEGLEPTHIARRLGVPAGTVRWRIKEGLERLRRGLDHAHGGDRKVWLLALAPIALWPRASRAAPAVALAVAALVVLGVGVGSAAQHALADDPVANAARSSRATDISRAGKRTDPPTATSWFVQADAPSRHVSGRVVRDSKPVAGAEVRLVVDDADPIVTRSAADGGFDFGIHAARTITLGAAMPDTLGAIRHVDLRDPTATTTDLELPLLPCAARVAGHVTDAVGGPIAHAQILREDTIGTETDDRGAYELCALPTAALFAQLDIVVHADGYGVIATGVSPAGRTIRDFVLTPEATIAGTASPDAAVWIDPDRDKILHGDERGARHAVIADADGRFRITGVRGGRYRIGGAARGLVATTALVSVAAGATTDIALTMTSAATVHGQLVMNGAPVAGARVAVREDEDGVALRHDDVSRDARSAGSAVTNAQGWFVLDGVPPGRVELAADPVRVVRPSLVLAAGDVTVMLEAKPLGRIRGVVRIHGEPVPYARVDANGPTPRGITADSAGRYEIQGALPGRYMFYADDQRRTAAGATPVVVLADGETRDFDIDLDATAQFTGTVVDLSGAPVAGVLVHFTSPTHERAQCMTDAAGAFVCGALRGGTTYEPLVWPGYAYSRPLSFATPVPALHLDRNGSADVRFAIDTRTISIAGTVRDENGAPAADVRVSSRSDELSAHPWVPSPSAMTDEAGQFRLEHLPPGDYRLYAEALHDTRTSSCVVSAGTLDATLTLVRPTCESTNVAEQPRKPIAPLIWDDRIELVGWDLPAHAQAGTPFEVTLVFRARASIAHPWEVFAHFDTPAGHRTTADHDPIGEACSTARWQPSGTYVDKFSVTLPTAEAFTLRVGMFRYGEGEEPFQNLVGPGGAAGAELGTVEVVAR